MTPGDNWATIYNVFRFVSPDDHFHLSASVIFSEHSLWKKRLLKAVFLVWCMLAAMQFSLLCSFPGCVATKSSSLLWNSKHQLACLHSTSWFHGTGSQKQRLPFSLVHFATVELQGLFHDWCWNRGFEPWHRHQILKGRLQWKEFQTHTHTVAWYCSLED